MAAATTSLSRNQIYHLRFHEAIIARVNRWVKDHPEQAKASSRVRTKRFLHKHPEKRRSVTDPEGERSRLLDARTRKRQEAIDALGGPQCVKCGYDADERALHIDHIHGGGGAEHKLYGPYRFYRRVIELGTEVYQVLCANCNTIKLMEERSKQRIMRAKKS